MSFRLYIGGLPNSLQHSDVQWWLWSAASSWPDTVQIVRKNCATKCAVFVGFEDEEMAQHVLRELPGKSHFGNRLSISWSKDSKAGTGKGVFGGKTPAGPLPPGTESGASASGQQDVKPEVKPQVQDVEVMAQPAMKSVAVQVEPQVQDVEVMAQPAMISVAVQVEPQLLDVDVVLQEDVAVQASSPLSEKTDQISPTENACSPTESPGRTVASPTHMSSDPPTCIVKEEHGPGFKLEAERVKIKEELVETKKERNACLAGSQAGGQPRPQLF